MAGALKFEEFCRLCEKISNANKDQKLQVLNKFLTYCRNLAKTAKESDSAVDTTLYPVLRLLLPKLDTERGPYGVKEHNLAKTYIRILCLPKEGQDANKLLKFRTPAAGATAGDFADVAFWVLKSRCRDGKVLSVADVNQHLDRIAVFHASNKPRSVDEELTIMLKSMSAEEQKWLIRVILKEMRFGLGQNKIFSAFHPDAKDHYDVSNNLKKVCNTLHDTNKRLHEIDVTLFEPCRPMLSERCDILNIEAILKLVSFYYVEKKHDGERFQLHYKQGKFQYFSRNGHNYTDTYGEYQSSGVLTPLLAPQINSTVENCILDGEMMGWNQKTNSFGSKGMNFDVKSLREGNVHQPCFCVFDVLLLNDEVLTNKPFQERLEFLSKVFTSREGVIVSTDSFKIRTSEEALKALNRAIDNREEGIILKSPLSVYKPNARKAGWYKIKPEYTDGLMNELDLLIIGGYYGEGRRKATISHFLVGVAVPPDHEGAEPIEFHSVGKVGSGYTTQELSDLLEKFKSNWKRVHPNQKPPGLVWTKERPDVWISPQNSIILQIKATEIVQSDLYQTGYTLRFPRVEKVRYDKPWTDCCTTVEFEELRNAAMGKLSTRHVKPEDLLDAPSRKRQRVIQSVATLGKDFQPADISSVEQSSNLLSGRELCVLNGNDQFSKQDLEKLIVQHGGTIIQHEGPETFCLVAGKRDIRVLNYSEKDTDIVTVDWLLRTIESNSFLEWTPLDLLATSSATRQKLEMEFDRFDDSFRQPATEESLRHSLKRVAEMGETMNLRPSEMKEIDDLLFTGSSPFGIFRCCLAYFLLPCNDAYEDECEMLQSNFRFQGGNQDECISPGTTHVIVHAADFSAVPNLKAENHKRKKKFHIVTYDWIASSWEVKNRLREADFHPESDRYKSQK